MGSQKNRINQKKHGVSFEEAKTVFYDDNSIQFWDDDYTQI
nr:BrnT family toxin [Cyanothece sp. BG0011]